MPRRPLSAALAALAALLLTAAPLGAQTITLEHTDLEVVFERLPNTPQPGERLELQSMRRKTQNLPQPAAVDHAAGSGGWTVQLAMRPTEPVGPGTSCEGVAAQVEWFRFSSDGTTDRWNPAGRNPLGTLDALDLANVTLTPGPFGAVRLVARWTGTVTLEGQGSDFEVTTDWTLRGGEPAVQTDIRVALTTPGALGFYVSEVRHPEVRVASMNGPSTPADTLVVPWVTGMLVEDPTNDTLPFTTGLADGLNFFPVNLSAYYENGGDQNCFVIYADDGEAWWKDLWINVAGPPGGRYVSFRMRHVPEDVFATKDHGAPYAVRLGVTAGDWWDAVDTYRDFLQTEVPWYQGPVGSPAHPMPQAAKDTVAEVFMLPGYRGDNMDELSRQMMNVTRVLGEQVSTVWYGGHYPDTFDHWFWAGGYLPGWNSLVGAIREAQKQFDHRVSPYVNGTLAADYLDPDIPQNPPPPPPTQDLLDVHDSFVLGENLEEIYFCYPAMSAPRQGTLCNGAPWWQERFPQHVAEIASFTSMKGVYIDYFLTSACWADDHGPVDGGPTHLGHAPGGGTWMYDNRMQQLRDMKDTVVDELAEDLVITMEFLGGRYTEEVHVMHHDPVKPALAAGTHPTGEPAPMTNAVSIPLFRALHDNVKLSRITSERPGLAGRASWVEANNTFTYGMIPGTTQPLAEWLPAFSQRFAYAAYYNFFASYTGGLPGSIASTITPPGTGSSTDVFGIDKDALNSPYYRFLGTITRALRDHGLRTWHNGTIRRLPDMTVTPVVGFTGVPGVETNPDPPVLSNPTYVEEPVTPGMFQAPPDIPGPDAESLAFVLANPWVDPSQQAAFPVEFTFLPRRYPGWADTTTYSITRYDADGGVFVVPGSQQGPQVLSRTVPPGEITWWVFRKL